MLNPIPGTPAPRPTDEVAVLSVSSLNRMARSLLEANFPRVLVEGEISNLAMPASGHWYLTLKDKNSQLRCAMFANRNRRLRFRPENGQQVQLRGRLSIYEGRGDYQLIVDDMEEAGDGALRRAFEELKARLLEEGLFDAAHKQEVPANCRHIGVITSPTGAAIRDIISVFARRFPATRLTLIPVAVQGREAADEIVRALNLANRLADKLGLQALIVGRGGGSMEDLQAFNTEPVARAIFASRLPVTSAVGHETDFSIADFVADQRAPTPSAAAELMSPSQQEVSERIAASRENLKQFMLRTLTGHRQRLANLQRHLRRPDRRLQDHAQTLDRLELGLKRAQRQRLQALSERLLRQRRSLSLHSPQAALTRSRERLSTAHHRLSQALRGGLAERRGALAELSRGLDAVSPLNTLARGYSISYGPDGAVLRRAESVSEGDRLSTRLRSGRLEATVTAVHPESEDPG